METVVQTKFFCPKQKPISACYPGCENYELCEAWKQEMFQFTTEMLGHLCRGIFLGSDMVEE